MGLFKCRSKCVIKPLINQSQRESYVVMTLDLVAISGHIRTSINVAVN